MDLYKNDGTSIDVMLKNEHVTDLGGIMNDTQKDFEIPMNGTFLLVFQNDYAAGAIYLVQRGVHATLCKINDIVPRADYYTLTSKTNHSITVKAGNASSHLYLIKLY